VRSGRGRRDGGVPTLGGREGCPPRPLVGRLSHPSSRPPPQPVGSAIGLGDYAGARASLDAVIRPALVQESTLGLDSSLLLLLLFSFFFLTKERLGRRVVVRFVGSDNVAIMLHHSCIAKTIHIFWPALQSPLFSI
jgi:hypothetical protein